MTNDYDIFPKPQAKKLISFSAYEQYQKAAIAGYFVLTGCTVTRSSTSAVNVAAGTYSNGGITKTFAGGSLSSISFASVGKQKIGLFYIDGEDDTLKITYGTEETPTNSIDFLENYIPLPPNLGSQNWIVLALARITDSGITDTSFGDPSYASGSVANIRYSGSMAVDNSTISIANGQITTHVRKHNIDGTDDHNGLATGAENDIVTLTSGKLPQSSGIKISTDGTMNDNSDTKVPTEKALVTYVSNQTPTLPVRILIVPATAFNLNGPGDVPELVVHETTNQHLNVLAFDDTDEETARMEPFIVPSDIDPNGTITFYAAILPKTAVSTRNIQLRFKHVVNTSGDGTVNTTFTNISNSGNVSPSGTTDRPVIGSWTVARSTLGWTAGQRIQGGLSRIAPVSGTNLSGDLFVEVFVIVVPVV